MKDLMRVLIAEDDDEDFELFSFALKDLSFPYVLMRAENGEILMNILSDHIPDILFLDIAMPCKDGRLCLREIRANKKFDRLPVIMYSSSKDTKTIEFCFEEHANGYVIKPASYAALKSILQRIFAIEWKKSMNYPLRPDFVINAPRV